MSDSQNWRDIGREDILSREAGRLAYPGSLLLKETAYGAGEGHGFDNLDTAPTVDRWYQVADQPQLVVSWMDEHLRKDKWNVKVTHEGAMLSCTRNRNTEWLSVVVYPQPPEVEASRVLYLLGRAQITATVSSTDASGTIYRVIYRIQPPS